MLKEFKFKKFLILIFSICFYFIVLRENVFSACTIRKSWLGSCWLTTSNCRSSLCPGVDNVDFVLKSYCNPKAYGLNGMMATCGKSGPYCDTRLCLPCYPYCKENFVVTDRNDPEGELTRGVCEGCTNPYWGYCKPKSLPPVGKCNFGWYGRVFYKNEKPFNDRPDAVVSLTDTKGNVRYVKIGGLFNGVNKGYLDGAQLNSRNELTVLNKWFPQAGKLPCQDVGSNNCYNSGQKISCSRDQWVCDNPRYHVDHPDFPIEGGDNYYFFLPWRSLWDLQMPGIGWVRKIAPWGGEMVQDWCIGSTYPPNQINPQDYSKFIINGVNYASYDDINQRYNMCSLITVHDGFTCAYDPYIIRVHADGCKCTEVVTPDFPEVEMPIPSVNAVNENIICSCGAPSVAINLGSESCEPEGSKIEIPVLLSDPVQLSDLKTFNLKIFDLGDLRLEDLQDIDDAELISETNLNIQTKEISGLNITEIKNGSWVANGNQLSFILLFDKKYLNKQYPHIFKNLVFKGQVEDFGGNVSTTDDILHQIIYRPDENLVRINVYRQTTNPNPIVLNLKLDKDIKSVYTGNISEYLKQFNPDETVKIAVAAGNYRWFSNYAKASIKCFYGIDKNSYVQRKLEIDFDPYSETDFRMCNKESETLSDTYESYKSGMVVGGFPIANFVKFKISDSPKYTNLDYFYKNESDAKFFKFEYTVESTKGCGKTTQVLEVQIQEPITYSSWLMTALGDTYAADGYNNKTLSLSDNPNNLVKKGASGETYFSTYLHLSGNTQVSDKTSFYSFLGKNYNESNKQKFNSQNSNIYSFLLNLYNENKSSGRCKINSSTTLGDCNNNQIYFINGGVQIPSNWLKSNWSNATGCIVIANGEITVDVGANVRYLNGIFVSNKFRSTGTGRLIIKGSVLTKESSFGVNNSNPQSNPAELIIYDARYLDLFRDCFGESHPVKIRELGY